MASAPSLQSMGLSVQLFPTIGQVADDDVTDRDNADVAVIRAPHRPMIVLFEPMPNDPFKFPSRGSRAPWCRRCCS